MGGRDEVEETKAKGFVTGARSIVVRLMEGRYLSVRLGALY